MAQPPLDPSHTVPQDLMPHVHLISSYRYPAMARIDLSEVAKWLMNAPTIARDTAPFFWTYLDKPADGTVLLTWQPLRRLGTTFASDGFVWQPPEQIFKHDLGNGLMLEIYWLKSGYIPGEQFAMHTRRRFRLVPVPGHPNPPQPDISLFVVHYGPAEPADRMPVNMIPYDERTNAMMQQRHFLQRAGQIRRKEFMLSDRVNWPSLPELTRQQMGPQATPRGVPQQMAYPPQTTPGPPAKRARHAPAQGQQAPMPGLPPLDPSFDDDEDTSRGDMFDHLTPREISLSRYQQNHEWMEEILSSPYRIHQITPADLGLGLKGELASLTEGIFTAQGGDAFTHGPEKPYVGRLDAGQADEFRKRVDKHIDSTKAEIEKMQAEHAEALAEFKKTSVLGAKEKELRSLVEAPELEAWRVSAATENEQTVSAGPKTTVEEIVGQVEASFGRKIESKPTVARIQDGGYQAPAPEPEPEPAPQPEPAVPAATTDMSRQPSHAESQNSGILIGESDIDMGNTAAGLLDQMHTGLSSTSTPVNNFPTPQPQVSGAQSNAATPSNLNVASPAPAPPAAAAQPIGDVSMGGTETRDQAGSAPDQGTGSGDWVVVPKGGATPDPAAGAPSAAAASTKGPSAAATPAVTDGGSATYDNFSSLDDLDTAGDALAGYDSPALDDAEGGLGDDLDLNMEMDDTAFGNAFVDESAATPGDGQGHEL